MVKGFFLEADGIKKGVRGQETEQRKKSEVSRLRLMASAFVKTSARQVGAPRRSENSEKRLEERCA